MKKTFSDHNLSNNLLRIVTQSFGNSQGFSSYLSVQKVFIEKKNCYIRDIAQSGMLSVYFL